MRCQLFLLCLLLEIFLLSCESRKESNSLTDSTNTVVADTTGIPLILEAKDTLMMDAYISFGSQINPAILRETPFYSGVDASFVIMKSLPILTSVRLLETGGIYTKNPVDTTIPNRPRYALKKGLLKIAALGDTGYISREDLCYFHLQNSKAKCHYLITVNDSANSELLIYKYGSIQKKFLDTLSVFLGGSDSEFLPDLVRFRDDIGLRNVSGTIDLYRIDEYCGGGTFSKYVVDANDSLSLLLTVGASGELCDGFSSTICLPYVKNGDTLTDQKNWNKPALKKALITILKDPKISPRQLIVKSNYAQSGIYDDQGEAILEEDGSCKYIITQDLDEIYYWTGQKLLLLSSADHLK